MSNKAKTYGLFYIAKTVFLVGTTITALVLLGLILQQSSQTHNLLVSTNREGSTASVRNNGCSGTTLTVSKTATMYRTQTDTYTWNVTKEATSSQLTEVLAGDYCKYLPPFNVQAHRTLANRETRTFIAGTITVTNGGEFATVGLAITDTLQVNANCYENSVVNGFFDFYGPVTVDISSSTIIPAGETRVYYYELDLALIPNYNYSCTYRNTVDVTILNHAGCVPGCGICPGPELCACGPAQLGGGVKSEITPLNGITVIEYNENAAIEDIVTCPEGFSCLTYPEGLTQIPTTDICTFDGSIANCVYMISVCNVNASCDTNTTVLDAIRLTTQEEVVPQITTSNIVSSPVYTGECPANGCTLTIGYWKTHAGFTGNNADRVSQYLPILLGCPTLAIPPYTKGANVTSPVQSTAILTVNTLTGGASNGLNKLAAQLLAAKLNVAHNAPSTNAIANGDAALCQYGFNPGAWSTLSQNTKNAINNLASTLDAYNNGLSGVPHCA